MVNGKVQIWYWQKDIHVIDPVVNWWLQETASVHRDSSLQLYFHSDIGYQEARLSKWPNIQSPHHTGGRKCYDLHSIIIPGMASYYPPYFVLGGNSIISTSLKSQVIWWSFLVLWHWNWTTNVYRGYITRDIHRISHMVNDAGTFKSDHLTTYISILSFSWISQKNNDWYVHTI